MAPRQMTKADASRIQSPQAKSGGDMSSKGFAARAQSTADRGVAGALISNRGMNAGGPNSGRTGGNNQGGHNGGWFQCSLM